MNQRLLPTLLLAAIVSMLLPGCTKSSTTSTKTQVVFFVTQDCGYGDITTVVNGDTQVISKYFANGTPACGQSGTATYTLAAGKYLLSAHGGTVKWNDSFTVIANQCNAYSLNCYGGASGSGTTTYYYANWTCNGSSQCITVMGSNAGTDGPFCSNTDCQAWGNKFIPGGFTCATTPAYSPIQGGTPPNGVCFKIGDF
jgi:hypothetical protein